MHLCYVNWLILCDPFKRPRGLRSLAFSSWKAFKACAGLLSRLIHLFLHRPCCMGCAGNSRGWDWKKSQILVFPCSVMVFLLVCNGAAPETLESCGAEGVQRLLALPLPSSWSPLPWCCAPLGCLSLSESVKHNWWAWSWCRWGINV